MEDLILILIVVSFLAFMIKKTIEKEQNDKAFIAKTITTKTSLSIKYDKIIVLNKTVQNNEFPYVAFNNEDKKVIIKQRTVPIKYINYDDIVGIEIIEDGTASLSFGNIIGGSLLAGGAGAIIGGMNKKDTVSNMSIKISLDNFNTPSYEIKLITTKISKKSIAYIETVKVANEVIDTVKYIINNKQKI